MADSLNRTVIEKDALRDLQKSEVERQIQMRQNAWSERLTQSRQELDDQRAAHEAERAALVQEHHQKVGELTEDCNNQVSQARRQLAAAELAAVEKTGKLANELKQALQADLERQIEDRGREVDARWKLEVQRREEAAQIKLKQREQQLQAQAESRLSELQTQADQVLSRREAELKHQLETQAHEAASRT